MLYQYIRAINSDNGTLTDYSIENQEESTTLPFYLIKDEDYYYIAQHFPFNNFYMDVNTANDVACDISLEYWDNTDWRSAVDILDGTKTSGVPLAKSGVIQFTPNSEYRWHITSDTTTGTFPTELSSLTIYNVYWLRISYSETLKNTTLLNRIAYAFSQHQQIDNLDVTVNDYLETFASGKTSWNDEIVTASLQVVMDLKARGLIVARGEVLRFDDVSMATDWRTLMLIYRNLGGDFATKLTESRLEYNNALSIRRFSFDKNQDAFLSRGEITNTVSRMVR